ncbi:hypothetical protein C1H46_001318 [Malus baccata]|uniref:Uncharacterized protein n=1 Tax=Malus baccata TaxID=106549 RepID=A0A540NQC1_MALBA|nr:hypothetical protein C1H46_001318 [Malus baccata]
MFFIPQASLSCSPPLSTPRSLSPFKSSSSGRNLHNGLGFPFINGLRGLHEQLLGIVEVAGYSTEDNDDDDDDDERDFWLLLGAARETNLEGGKGRGGDVEALEGVEGGSGTVEEGG